VMDQQEIDCGAQMNVAIDLLSLAPDVVQGNVTLVKVQMIRRWHPLEADCIVHRYKKSSGENAAALGNWIEDNVFYHQCIGFFWSNGNSFRMWDYGEWFLPTSNPDAAGAILAVKLTPGRGRDILPAHVVWNDLLTVQTGIWTTLLPEAIHDIPNSGILRSSISWDEQKAVLSSVFKRSIKKPISKQEPKTYSCARRVERLEPVVFVSGNHMSTNPMPGVGVSRAIRLRFPHSRITAVDHRMDHMLGRMDVTFDRNVALHWLLDHKRGVKKYDDMYLRFLTETFISYEPTGIYLPCTDHEVERLAKAMNCSKFSTELKNRLLCPPLSAIKLTLKPQIAGAVSMGCFEIPAFLEIIPEKIGQTEVETWCKLHGYPVVVKGEKQGAAICGTWSAVQSALANFGVGGYIQEIIHGWQMGVAYSSYKGELLAAILMEKIAFNGGSKAWSGQMKPCPPVIRERLKKFCVETNWTGGGELEYIEDFNRKWHMIDWNPRFPAWTFGACYAGVNLPGCLIQKVLNYQDKEVPAPVQDWDRGLSACGVFNRSVVEIPVFHVQPVAHAGFVALDVGQKGKGSACESQRLAMLPPAIEKRFLNMEDTHLNLNDEQQQVLKEVQRLVPTKIQEQAMTTPCFILSRETVRTQLKSHKTALESAVGQLDSLKLQMCISVKTQPHNMVLDEARKAGYLGEVITKAEMRACLDAGWKMNEIVFNGPGKWYDTPERVNEDVPPGILNCIFADSVADLKTIVDRIVDPADWLNAKYVGIRFAPAWGIVSRFGLDPNDPTVLLAAAEQIKRLPARCNLGLHMHFASSKTGPRQWFGYALAFIEIATHFVTLCGKNLEVLDFGGGWPSHLLDDTSLKPLFNKIFKRAVDRFPHLSKVMFEPGKSLTERAGALLTKVLEIREMPNRKIPKSKPNFLNDACAIEEGMNVIPAIAIQCNNTSQQNEREKEIGEKPVIRRAAIVDACISDLGSMPLHTHPLL